MLNVFYTLDNILFSGEIQERFGLHNNLVTSRRSGNIYAYLKQQSLFPAFYDSSSTLLQPLSGVVKGRY